jgi:hypothetical protein
MFRHVVHCDWSMRAAGRWMATARRIQDGSWSAAGPRPVPDSPAFLDELFVLAEDGPTLVGFDFPIGFPAGYGAAIPYPDFLEALDAIGRRAWPEIFEVAGAPDEIGPLRPFYPRRPGAARLRHLLNGHGVERPEALVRVCERAGLEGGSAGCMFWTLGAKQVGKAALSGWREVIGPARCRGAKIWPFDGGLAALSARGGLTLAETYPGDAYGQIGLSFAGKSKRRISDRASFAPAVECWAASRAIALDDDLTSALRAGFPPVSGNDDGFDAAVGLLAAIAVVTGERPGGEPPSEEVHRWEGWILGKRIA